MTLLFFLAAALRISVPYTLAALGAAITERGGVVNIALEGMMLNGALAYVLAADLTGDAWAGVAAAVAAGLATAALHALVTVVARADQITSGLGINLLAAGLTKFVLTRVYHSSSNSPRVVGLPDWDLAGLAAVPGIGPVFVLMMMMTFASWFSYALMLFKDFSWSRAKEAGKQEEASCRDALYKTLAFLVGEAILCTEVTPFLTPVLYMLTSTFMFISYKDYFER